MCPGFYEGIISQVSANVRLDDLPADAISRDKVFIKTSGGHCVPVVQLWQLFWENKRSIFFFKVARDVGKAPQDDFPRSPWKSQVLWLRRVNNSGK